MAAGCEGLAVTAECVKHRRAANLDSRSVPGLSILAACCVLFFGGASPAFPCADGLACGVVTPTPDGFLALRSRPSLQSPIIGRLRPYDIVVWGVSDCRPNREEDLWRAVECVPRLDGPCGSQNRKMSAGWASAKHIVTTDCPVDFNSQW